MKIKNILNNSALVAVNDKDEEIILIGKGISFQKHPGDEVDTSKIEKEFERNTKKANELMELIDEIPEKYFEITNAIIRYAKKKLKKDLDKSVYITMFDHINSAVERYEDGIALDFAMLSEIKTLYPEEFAIASWALDYLNVTLDIDLVEDEAGFMAIHIISGLASDSDLSETKKVMRIVKDISSVVLECYNNKIDEESMSYSRFLTHLKYLAMRYLRHEQIENTDLIPFTLHEKAIEETLVCLEKINEIMKSKYNSELSEYEEKYIILHLCRLMNI